MQQGSEEWKLARVGRVTASRVSDVIAKTKTGWKASRANYMAELIVERLTGRPVEQYTNAAMQWGTLTEPQAVAAYAFYTDTDPVEVGFIKHPSLFAGASPDRLIGHYGLLEAKCPNTATHIATLLGEPIPKEYMCQMQFQLATTGRDWCDWISYDPRLPVEMRLYVERVQRNEEMIGELTDAVSRFLIELEVKLDNLKMKYQRADA